MSVKRKPNQAAANPFPAVPENVPGDGTEVRHTYTFAREVGPQEGGRKTAEDYEDSEWVVRVMTDRGWTYHSKTDGRPYEPDVAHLGPGQYQVAPIDDDGRPDYALAEILRIISPVSSPNQPRTPHPDGPKDDMPAWVKMQLQLAAQEKASASEREQRADEQRRRWEHDQKLREQERLERLDRQEESRLERAEEERRARQDQMSAIITQIGGVVQASLSVFGERSGSKKADVNEALLAALISERGGRTPEGNNMRDTLEMLMVLDQLAENRRPPPEEAADDGIMKSLVSALPAALAMKGGGGAPQAEHPAQLPLDSGVIAAAAMQDPDAAAVAFVSAVKGNPVLESAVLRALDDGGESE